MSDNSRATKRALQSPRPSEASTTDAARVARRRSKLWPPGVHVAPYLSPRGRFVLIAIGEGNYLMVAAEASTLGNHRGRPSNVRPDVGYPTSILEPRAEGGRHGTIPFLASLGALKGGRPLDALLWPRGVYLAPWRDAFQYGEELGFGRPMIAIDANRRLVAEMMVPDGADPEPVRSDLLAILEAVEAENAGLGSVSRSA